MKYLRVIQLVMIVVMILWYVTGFAQTLSTDAPPQQKAWEIFLKVLFPAVWTVGAPWVTGLITSGIKHVPSPLRVIISSVLGAITAGLAGAIPDFPLTIESASEMGAAGGATGQVLALLQPGALKPKTAAVKAELNIK